MCTRARPVRVKVTARTTTTSHTHRVHIGVNLIKWDSVTHQRSETSVAAAMRRPRGWHSARRPADQYQRQRRFRSHRSAQTPENRTVEARPGSGSGTTRRVVQPEHAGADRRRQEDLPGGDTAHLLLVTGLNESWPWSRGGQQRAVAASDSRYQPELRFDISITKLAQPNLVVSAVIVHDNQLITAQKSLKVRWWSAR